MNKQSAELLAKWLAKNQPKVFEALVKASNRAGQLNGITDWLSSVGTSLGTAAKSVGSFLASPDGVKTLGTIGGIYLQTQTQKDALKLQIANAQAGYAPAPVQSVGANPNYSMPVYIDPVTGYQQPFTSQLAQQLTPPMNWQSLLPWIAVAGLGLILVIRK